MVTQRLFAGLTCAVPLALERGVGATVPSPRKMGQAGRAPTLRETATPPWPFAPLRVKSGRYRLGDHRESREEADGEPKK